MRARTVTLGTSSKLLSLTGWRVGWCPSLSTPSHTLGLHFYARGRMTSGNAQLLAACRSVHAYATFCAPVPLQLGVAAALHREIDLAHSSSSSSSSPAPLTADTGSHLAYTSQLLADNARALSRALQQQQLRVCPASGGYFIIVDVSATQLADVEFCRQVQLCRAPPPPTPFAGSS